MLRKMNDPAQNDNDLVILIHGFACKSFVMWPMAARLRKREFRVQTWSYWTLFHSIEVHAARLHEFLTTELASEQRIHIVAHSMGTIVARAALNRGAIPNLGRVVLLAPPNRGSPVARITAPIFGRLIPPSRELSNSPASYVNQLVANANLEIGVIAAKYDILIPARNTHLPNQTQHVTVNATHNSLLFSRKVCNHAVNFIRCGNFEIC
jgi:pimeloyl-ACP methyl ester carboxylesterase